MLLRGLKYGTGEFPWSHKCIHPLRATGLLHNSIVLAVDLEAITPAIPKRVRKIKATNHSKNWIRSILLTVLSRGRVHIYSNWVECCQWVPRISEKPSSQKCDSCQKRFHKGYFCTCVQRWLTHILGLRFYSVNSCLNLRTIHFYGSHQMCRDNAQIDFHISFHQTLVPFNIRFTRCFTHVIFGGLSAHNLKFLQITITLLEEPLQITRNSHGIMMLKVPSLMIWLATLAIQVPFTHHPWHSSSTNINPLPRTHVDKIRQFPFHWKLTGALDKSLFNKLISTTLRSPRNVGYLGFRIESEIIAGWIARFCVSKNPSAASFLGEK